MDPFKWGDPVVILGLNVDGAHFDVPGVYYAQVVFGRYLGRHRVKAMGVDNLFIERARLMSSDDYFKIYNTDGLKEFPKGATGRLFFRESIESEGTRGNLLGQMIIIDELPKGGIGDGTKTD